jgi:hypothetical protein
MTGHSPLSIKYLRYCTHLHVLRRGREKRQEKTRCNEEIHLRSKNRHSRRGAKFRLSKRPFATLLFYGFVRNNNFLQRKRSVRIPNTPPLMYFVSFCVRAGLQRARFIIGYYSFYRPNAFFYFSLLMRRSEFYRHYLGEVALVEEVLHEDHKLLDVSPSHQEGCQVRLSVCLRPLPLFKTDYSDQ